MSLLSRSLAVKAGLAAAVALLAAGGTVVGVAAGSASASPHAAASTTIDHQLCYTASPQGPFRIPRSVMLKNQFSTTPFAVKIGSAVIHCNPVAKTLPTGQVFPITNPSAHLLCWSITESAQPTPVVTVTNQFGSAVLQPSQPNLLCLPTWKSLTAPPNQAVNHPPGLSHFTCYPVKELSGGYNPPPVMLQDEFAPGPVPAQVNPVPAELCLPTEKIVGTRIYKIVNSTWHLLCFPVSPTPVISPVFDQNQFVPRPPGGVPITIGRTIWLCPPSTKKIG